MFKKILALFLFTCLLLSAAGCGNKQQAAEESGSFPGNRRCNKWR